MQQRRGWQQHESQQLSQPHEASQPQLGSAAQLASSAQQLGSAAQLASSAQPQLSSQQHGSQQQSCRWKRFNKQQRWPQPLSQPQLWWPKKADALPALEAMAARGDTSGFANADTNFHRALCALSGNDVICNLWEGLARQVTIFFGLSALRKPMDEIIDEHRTLIAVFRSGDVEAMTLALDDHIRAQTHAVDFEAIILAHRAERAASGG